MPLSGPMTIDVGFAFAEGGRYCETTPAGVICQMEFVPGSVTQSDPFDAVTMPQGRANGVRKRNLGKRKRPT